MFERRLRGVWRAVIVELASEYAFYWLMVCALGLTLTLVTIFRWQSLYAYDAVVVDGIAPWAYDIEHVIPLDDRHRVVQTFVAPAPYITHVAIGIENRHHAAASSQLNVELYDNQDHLVATQVVNTASLLLDDVTPIPLPASVEVGQMYRLQVSTAGVTPTAALTLHYEDDESPEHPGTVKIVTTEPAEQSETVPGTIRFQIIRYPAAWVLWSTWWQSRIGYGLTLYWLVLLASILRPVRPVVKKITHSLSPPLPSFEQPLAWRELWLPLVVGTIMAAAVTWPYYYNLDRVTASGDINRALVYRAIARDALLRDGEVARWDAYLCGGVPLLANAESAHLDPFFLLVVMFGANLGTRLSVTATLILGFVGTYVLSRRFLHTSRLSSLVAGAIFSFSGFQMLAFANGNYTWLPVGWIPWFMYFFMKSLRTPWWTMAAAAVAAAMFFGGSVHMWVYALLAAAFLATILAILYRTARPIFVLGLTVAAFVSLSAIKLLPAMALQVISADWSRPPPFIQPLSWLPKMFWGRDQLATAPWLLESTGEYFRWYEYGSYVGILPVILFVIAIPLCLRRRLPAAILITALILLGMTFAYFPWSTLQTLPFLDEILRNPQRARVVFFLFAGLVAAVGLDTVRSRLGSISRKSGLPTNIAAIVVTLFILADLATFHTEKYHNVFRLPAPMVSPSPQFIRLENSYTVPGTDYYKVGYVNYLAGQGTTDLCIPYMVARGVAARGADTTDLARPYFGEARLSPPGQVHAVTVRPNHITISFKPARPGWLVINQNYFPGWQAEPARTVGPTNKGLLGVRVGTEDREITLTYRPAAHTAGAALTSVVLIYFIAVVATHRRKASPPQLET